MKSLLTALITVALAVIGNAAEAFISIKEAHLDHALRMIAYHSSEPSVIFQDHLSQGRLSLRTNAGVETVFTGLCEAYAIKHDHKKSGNSEYTLFTGPSPVAFNPLRTDRDEELKRLRLLPSVIEWGGSVPLAEVIWNLTSDAGVDCVYDPSVFSEHVSIGMMTGSPWTILETICARAHVRIVPTNIGWAFVPEIAR